MTDAELMLNLFEGSDVAYGSTELTGKITAEGKHEARCVMIRKPVQMSNWELHLSGKVGLGVPPINTKNMVKFGAIDVDVYQSLDLEKLNAKLVEHKIPMVLCRSKSGGPHLFMFMKEWVPAKLAVEKLDAIAGFMGFGKSEIFPKQTSVTGNDVGNFINMPYFGGVRFLRYAYDAEGKAIKEIKTFSDFAMSRALTRAELEAYQPPSSGGLLPDGPPCLNRLMAAKTNENRNIILANIAVYCKKAFPEEWEAKVDEYNQMFPDPLGSKEVEAIKKSYAKKDYKFQCNICPLSTYCNSSACRKAKHGIGGDDLMPTQRSLTKINTNPPVWYLDVAMADDTFKRMSLTTEELQNPRLFERRCMDTIQKMPPMVKPEEWQPKVAALMAHCTVIDIPEELSPVGQFKELVVEFLLNRASAEGWEDLLRGLPHKNEAGYHFRAKDLWKYVTNQRFTLMNQHEMLVTLTRDMKAVKTFRNIKGTGVNLLTVRFDDVVPEKLEPTNENPAY